MRRRRKGNNVLARTMLISVGIVICLLPVLGYLGAFKAVKEQFTQVSMVELPPPPPMPKEKIAHKAHPHVEHHGREHVQGSSKPLPVHVAAAATAPGSSSDDNTIVNGSNTNVGVVPVAPVAAPPPPAPVAAPPTAPAAPPPSASTAAPAPAPLPSPPPVPVIASVPASVIASSQVKPVIPSDLRDSDLDATVRALFTVHADGSADVQMVQSSGNNELDQLALQAAREWKFTPALRNGQPVQSYLRLWVEFQVG